ncbi:MAG TPA: phosphoribosyltransferase [Acidimicrobiales bacterium]|nr:phosphoribosyltransferase [Acidimicrobiales bacterium]
MAFADRRDAGRRLAEVLVRSGLFDEEQPAVMGPVVMGMARGGVPVAFEVSSALDAPLDVVVVRKLGHPRQPELGLGAIGEDGVRVTNDALVAKLGVPEDVIDGVAAQEAIELERRLVVCRGGRAPVEVLGRTVIVVDDGLATGFTARAAIEVMRRRGAARVVLAVPVGPPDAVEALRDVADAVVCVETPKKFFGLSEWYEDFSQLSDDEVARFLVDRPVGPVGAA